MIVVTLTKVPQSLRGDLTKWYQEIQTGVYVGSVSARIRDLLWQRVEENIGNGEATMVYNTNSELGYQIKTTRKNYKIVDYDGIPLVMRLTNESELQGIKIEHGFSNAAKFHSARIMTQANKTKSIKEVGPEITALDLETTGLKVDSNQIISIGAVKKLADGSYVDFYKLIRVNVPISRSITALTGITNKLLENKGITLKTALLKLCDFIKNTTIVGYNLRFDEEFLAYNLKQVRLTEINNKNVDLLPVVKKAEKFLDNYKLKTVLEFYKIKNENPHNALSDAQATMALANKLIKNGMIYF